MQALLDNLAPLLQGLLTTLWMAALSAVGALVLGVVVTAMRVSPIPVLRGVAFAYVQLFLNVPLLALLVLFVFALPDAGLLMPLPMTAVVVLVDLRGRVRRRGRAQRREHGGDGPGGGGARARADVPADAGVGDPAAGAAGGGPAGRQRDDRAGDEHVAVRGVGIVELTAAANKTNLVHAQPIPIFVGAGLTYMALALLIGLGTGWLERTGGDRAMTPRSLRRARPANPSPDPLWSVVSGLVLAGVVGLGLWQFAKHGQLDAARWAPFTQWPIWEYLLVGLLGTLEAAAYVAVLSAVGGHLPRAGPAVPGAGSCAGSPPATSRSRAPCRCC